MAETLKTITTASMTIISISFFFFFFFFFFPTLVTADNTNNIPTFSETLTPKNLALHNNQERLTHLHFYFHDSVNGKNPTAVRVAKGATTDKSKTAFGLTSVMDDPLTVGPDRASKPVGSAQGIYVYTAQTDVALLMVMNLVFTEGKYNGSTLSVFGHNAILSAVREIPIIGGSGLFRFARGYAQTRTYSFNTTSLDAVLEYDVYVFH